MRLELNQIVDNKGKVVASVQPAGSAEQVIGTDGTLIATVERAGSGWKSVTVAGILHARPTREEAVLAVFDVQPSGSGEEGGGSDGD